MNESPATATAATYDESTGTNTRTSTITADDSRGFWTVTAVGVETWHACSRSLETAVSLATYASMIGESPRGEWTYADAEESAPYSLVCDGYRGGIAVAVSEFQRMELVWSAYVRGTLLTQAPLLEDDAVSDDDYHALEGGAILPLGERMALKMDAEGYVRVLAPGKVYTDTDGTRYDFSATAVTRGGRVARTFAPGTTAYHRPSDMWVSVITDNDGPTTVIDHPYSGRMVVSSDTLTR